MTNDIKIFLGILGGTLLLIFGAAFLLGKGDNNSVKNSGGQTIVGSDVLVKNDSWSIGTPSAKVTLVEFSDFECPACKASQPQLKSILAKYQDKIRFVYRHFSLPVHPYAVDAAVAAEAAGRQGKFWEMHDKLFDNQPDFQKDQLIGLAKDLGLDVNKFTADLDSSDLRQKVLSDQADGKRASVDATPTFFVNGIKYIGVSDLDSVISTVLK